MGVKIRISKGRIYLDVYANGQRRWESLGLTVPNDKQQAKEIMRLAEVCRSKREAQITSGEWGLIDPVSGKQTLIEYIETMNKGKGSTVAKALKFINLHNRGNIAIANVTEKWLEDFQDFLLRDTGLSKSTASHYEGVVRQALKKAARDRVIPRNPAIGVKSISVPESDIIYLELNEVKKLAKTELGGDLGAEVKRAFLFGCFTGLRVSDLKSLQWGAINREPLQIAKKQEKTERKVFIPLHETAWKIINDGAIHNHKAFIFPRLTQSKTNTNDYLKRWVVKAGIEKTIGWHTARRTFAVLSLESGAEIYTVSKLLDHANLKTTQVYAKVTDTLKRKAVNALPGIEI